MIEALREELKEEEAYLVELQKIYKRYEFMIMATEHLIKSYKERLNELEKNNEKIQTQNKTKSPAMERN